MLFAIKVIDASGKLNQARSIADRLNSEGLKSAKLSLTRCWDSHFGESNASFTHQKTHIGSQA